MTKSMVAHSKNNGSLLATTEKVADILEREMDRTCNPLLNPEMLCSWFFKHFLASYITVFHGVWQGFVPRLVPRLPKPSKCRTVMCVTEGQVSDFSPHDDWMAKYFCLGPKPFACWM